MQFLKNSINSQGMPGSGLHKVIICSFSAHYYCYPADRHGASITVLSGQMTCGCADSNARSDAAVMPTRGIEVLSLN